MKVAVQWVWWLLLPVVSMIEPLLVTLPCTARLPWMATSPCRLICPALTLTAASLTSTCAPPTFTVTLPLGSSML